MESLTDGIIDSFRDEISNFISKLADVGKFELSFYLKDLNAKSNQKVKPKIIVSLLQRIKKYDPGLLLIQAITFIKEHLISIILKLSKSNPNVVDSEGISALFYAARKDLRMTVQSLLENDAIDVNIVNGPSGLTPLQIAVIEKNEFIVKRIAAHPKCDINYQDKRGYTALHYAAKYFKFGILDTLANHKKTIRSLVNKDGDSPYNVALSANNHVSATMVYTGLW